MTRSKHFRFAVVLAVIAAILFTLIPHLNVSAASHFSDVSDNIWYANAVNWAVDNNITSGTSPTTFSPDQPCTRAQIITFLYRYKGSPEVSGAMKFTDVTTEWMQKPVLWAAQNSITSGTNPTTFEPNTICTRAQVVTFLYRIQGNNEKATSQLFSDVTKSNYFYDAVSWAKNHNITSGTGDGKFNPNEPCTRAQAITFLYRAYQDADGTTVTPTPTPTETPVASSYVLNTRTKIFHLSTCSSVKRMSAANRKDVTESRDQIIAEGYTPCSICNP